MTSPLRLVAVLSLITLVSGLALGGLNELTATIIEENVLRFKKIPAAVTILEGAAGELDPGERTEVEALFLKTRRKIDLGDHGDVLLFVIERDGEPWGVTLEGFGKGFGGDLGVMVGFELDSDRIAGIGITTMSETPGVGTHVKDEVFRAQFAGMVPDGEVQITKDGGEVDAVTGATVSSRAVATAVGEAHAVFTTHRDAIHTAATTPLPEEAP